MPFANTPTEFGSAAKAFHWITALMVVAMFPLGIVANDLAEAIRDPSVAVTKPEIARTTLLFTVHKTLGLAVFFIAIARIGWAIFQPRPGLLNAGNKVEAFAAETVHWLLYGSLIIVPLSGWVHHSATTGFAPIWWPLGQDLPLVPKSEPLAEVASGLHFVFQYVFLAALFLHVVGALKHHMIDRDATLLRMLPGRVGAPAPPERSPQRLTLIAAILVWAGAIGGGVLAGALHFPTRSPDLRELAEVRSDWVVTDGQLEFEITQLGSRVAGTFSDWTAEIAFKEPAASGWAGSVHVVVSTESLAVGSVTDQAKGSDFFEVEIFPSADFTADIYKTDMAYEARGTLTIKDQSADIVLPFELELDGPSAAMTGSVSLNRMDFGIGQGINDEETLGLEVLVSVELTAQKQGEPGA